MACTRTAVQMVPGQPVTAPLHHDGCTDSQSMTKHRADPSEGCLLRICSCSSCLQVSAAWFCIPWTGFLVPTASTISGCLPYGMRHIAWHAMATRPADDSTRIELCNTTLKPYGRPLHQHPRLARRSAELLPAHTVRRMDVAQGLPVAVAHTARPLYRHVQHCIAAVLALPTTLIGAGPNPSHSWQPTASQQLAHCVEHRLIRMTPDRANTQVLDARQLRLLTHLA